MTTVSAAASVISSSSTTSSGLVKLASGEYTADSVAADPTDANKLGLVKEKDGNYGTQKAQVATTSSASTQSSTGLQAALTGLTLGGS